VIVVDTNIIVYFMIESDQTAAARRALRKDRDWVLPPRWRSEMRSALLGHLRAGTLDLDGALHSFTSAVMRFGALERQPDARTVLKIALDYGLDAYDSEFAALADELGVPLLTADEASLASKLADRLVLRLSSFSS
jgi:predicted nucleic acid-binding protein